MAQVANEMSAVTTYWSREGHKADSWQNGGKKPTPWPPLPFRAWSSAGLAEMAEEALG